MTPAKDITERLREGIAANNSPTLRDALAEIERLRALLPPSPAPKPPEVGPTDKGQEYMRGWHAGAKASRGWDGNDLIMLIATGHNGECKFVPVEGHVITPDGVVRKVNGTLPVNLSGDVVGHNATIYYTSRKGARVPMPRKRLNICDHLFRCYSSGQEAVDAYVRESAALAAKGPQQ